MEKITLFAQIVTRLDRFGFDRIVRKHQTDKHAKGYDSWTHLISMLFCQFAKSQSVRDISNGLRSATGNLNHLGVAKAPSKSSVSYQNKHRDWRIFRDYYFHLLDLLGQQKTHRKIKFRIKSKILLLDSTTISLCLDLFDWAHYKTAKGAVKLHTLLDYDGGLPVYVNVTTGKTGDNKGAYDIPLIPGSVVVADRFYADLYLLNVWDSSGVKFVVRHKENLQYTVLKENETPSDSPVRADQIIEFAVPKSKQRYPKKLRRVVVWNEEHQQEIELLTNNFTWSANTIGDLYKSRWQIEIFFREIKQLLHIKSFIGTTLNAVMIQIWTALITILLLKYLKAKAKYKWHLSNLVAFIRLNMYTKIDLQHWLDDPFTEPSKRHINLNQGVLFKSDA
ncbi:MAG: IS4 family transposase [Acidobacteria bacterium]|nr:IS4 family transposase [Acidobacteriota bacterium]